MGDPCGVPTETGAGRLAEPWKIRAQDHSVRNEETKSTI